MAPMPTIVASSNPRLAAGARVFSGSIGELPGRRVTAEAQRGSGIPRGAPNETP